MLNNFFSYHWKELIFLSFLSVLKTSEVGSSVLMKFTKDHLFRWIVFTLPHSIRVFFSSFTLKQSEKNPINPS